MRLALALLLLALAPLPAAAQEIDHAALARRAFDDHIRPGFARLTETAHALATATRTACAAPGPIDLAPIRAAYDATFDAWARIGHIRFGPGEENGTVFGIEFWPDTKSSTPRSLAALIADEGPAVDDPAAYTAPRGNMMLIFDLSGSGPVQVVESADICGVASAGPGFACSTGAGLFLRRSAAPVPDLRFDRVAFDNHLVRIAAVSAV